MLYLNIKLKRPQKNPGAVHSVLLNNGYFFFGGRSIGAMVPPRHHKLPVNDNLLLVL